MRDFNTGKDSIMYMKFINTKFKEVNFVLNEKDYKKVCFMFEAEDLSFLTNKDI